MAMANTDRNINNIGENDRLLLEACRFLNGASIELARDFLPLFIKNTKPEDGLGNAKTAVAGAAFLSRLIISLASLSKRNKNEDENKMQSHQEKYSFPGAVASDLTEQEVMQGGSIHLDSNNSFTSVCDATGTNNYFDMLDEKARDDDFGGRLGILSDPSEIFCEQTVQKEGGKTKIQIEGTKMSAEFPKSKKPTQIDENSKCLHKLDNHNGVYISGIATDLASLLVYFYHHDPSSLSMSSPPGQNNVAKGKNSKDDDNIETASDVMKKCLTLLYTATNMDTIHEIIMRQTPQSYDKAPSNEISPFLEKKKDLKQLKEEREQLRRSLKTILETIISECKTITSLKHDFDTLWNKYCTLSNKLTDSSSKNCAWALQSLVSILRRCRCFNDDGEGNKSSSEGVGAGDKVMECHKTKNRTRLMAACVALTIGLALMGPAPPPDPNSSTVALSSVKCNNKDADDIPESKKRKIDDHAQNPNKSCHELSSERKFRLSIENEAIAALSMMPNCGSPSPHTVSFPDTENNFINSIASAINLTPDELCQEIENIIRLVRCFCLPFPEPPYQQPSETGCADNQVKECSPEGKSSVHMGRLFEREIRLFPFSVPPPFSSLSPSNRLSDEEGTIKNVVVKSETHNDVSAELSNTTSQSDTEKHKRTEEAKEPLPSNSAPSLLSFFHSSKAREANSRKLEMMYRSAVSYACSLSFFSSRYQSVDTTEKKSSPVAVFAGQDTFFAAIAIDELRIMSDFSILDVLASTIGTNPGDHAAFPLSLKQVHDTHTHETVSSNNTFCGTSPVLARFEVDGFTSLPTASPRSQPHVQNSLHNHHPTIPHSNHFSHGGDSFQSKPCDFSHSRPLPPINAVAVSAFDRKPASSPPSFISSPINNNYAVSPVEASPSEWINNNVDHTTSSATVIPPPTPSSYADDAPLTNAISLVDWISRLCNDSSLTRPSWRLMKYFQHSETPTTKKGPELWSTVVSILNRSLQRLAEALTEDKTQLTSVEVLASGELLLHQSAPHFVFHNPGSVFSPPSGSTESPLKKKVIVSLLALYYNSLESILSMEATRLRSISHPKMLMMLQNNSFHRSLLAVCTECVIEGLSPDFLPFREVLRAMEIDPYDFLKVSGVFVRALCSPPPPRRHYHNNNDAAALGDNDAIHKPLGLPLALRRHMEQCVEEILDSLLWVSQPGTTSTNALGGMIKAISVWQQYSQQNNNKGSSSFIAWPPLELRGGDEMGMGNSNFETSTSASIFTLKSTMQSNEHQLRQYQSTVSMIMRKLLAITWRRIYDLSEKLSLMKHVIDLIWKKWKYFLSHHIHLLYDRHIDQFILCTIYAVCRVSKVVPEVTFKRILECYYDLNPGRDDLNRLIIREIKLNDDVNPQQHQQGGRKVPCYGNLVEMYNIVYVPAMKSHFLKNVDFLRHQLQRAKQQVKTVEDAARVADQAAAVVNQNCHYPQSPIATTSLPSGMIGPIHSVTPIRVENSNVYVSTTTAMPSPPQFKNKGDNLRTKQISRLGTRRGNNLLMPKTRAFYNFGQSSASDLLLINRTIQSGVSSHLSAPGFVSGQDHNDQNNVVIDDSNDIQHPSPLSSSAARGYSLQRRRK